MKVKMECESMWFFLINFLGVLPNQKQLKLVHINLFNFDIIGLDYGQKEIGKGEANPGIEQGNLRSWQGPKYVQNRPEFYIPIATGRDWVASHITLVQSDWRVLCQSTLPAAGQFCQGFFLQLG